jgi:DNA-binding beta-propeller fold protein YncE
MKTKKIFFLVWASAVFLCLLRKLPAQDQQSRTMQLPTSKNLTIPAPGFIAGTNSLPITIAVSPDSRYAAFLNQGYGLESSDIRQSIAILDLKNNRLREFPDDRLKGDEKTTRQTYFVGLVFSGDGQHLYASMASANENGIAVYKFANGEVSPERFVEIPPQHIAQGKTVTLDSGTQLAGTAPTYPAGLAVLSSASGDRLLVANNLSDSAVLLDMSSGQIDRSFDVSTAQSIPAAYPYTVVTNRAGTRAWVSLWNASTMDELDLETGKVVRQINLWRPADPTAAGTHPTGMLLDKKESTLYVVLSNPTSIENDGVVAIDVRTGTPSRIFRVGQSGELGTTPTALALSADEKHLYVAAASLNAIAVFNTEIGTKNVRLAVETPIGFVPTEWYPSAVATVGDDLLIASAKGRSSGPNNMSAKVQTGLHPNPHPYIATLIGGGIQRVPIREIDANLAAYTKQVRENNLADRPVEKITFAAGTNPIRHVIYILKENRTYDQILGDLGVGDGDPSLTMYGAEITPNEHKLALQFGVLDNFYDSGDVSANGHLWSDASATSDYIERTWPIIYRRAERPQNAGNTLDQDVPMPDDPGTGFLWDNLAKHNFTYRIYGEMLEASWCSDEKAASPREGTPSPHSAACSSIEIKPGEPLPPSISNPNGGPSPWPWPVPKLKSIRATKKTQREHIDPLYADFAIDYPDQLRADEFLREFKRFVQARGSAQELPQFVELFLPNDHTGGTRAGKPAPRASVADNDLAVGRVVDAVSHSPYWDDTAIFVIEDDAQNGADHVDAHRSVALIISKYSPSSKTPFVDHSFYTTVSMVHTMEELIGLPAMNLFDVHAPLMAPLFGGPGTQAPYQADYRNLNSGLLYEMNGKNAPGAKESAKMDFSHADAADARQLNAILWRDAKGVLKMPDELKGK